MFSFEIKNTDNGQGLFSSVHYEPNQIILKFDGKVLERQELESLSFDEQSVLLQVGKDLFLDLKNDKSFFINHSCNPNCGIRIIARVAFLVSLRPILPNEELTFDYSTTSNDEPSDWSIVCNCSQWNCRKLVSGFSSLKVSDKEKYLNLNVIPNYLKITEN